MNVEQKIYCKKTNSLQAALGASKKRFPTRTYTILYLPYLMQPSFPSHETIMPTLIHNVPTSLDAEVCTAGIFTYIIVVFVLVGLGMNELGTEARWRRRFPPSS